MIDQKRSSGAGVRLFVDKNVLDNIPYEKTSASLKRLNTSGSKSSIERWKQKKAEKYSFREIIAKLGFSGVLRIDEYKPNCDSDNRACVLRNFVVPCHAE